MTQKSPDQILEKNGIKLPPPPAPKGLYKPFLVSGNHAYVSGHGPIMDDGSLIRGRAGQDLDADQAKAAARQTGLAILATLKANLGDLNKIKRVIKIFGMVNATPDFERHPYVINGCSELFAEVFGELHGVGVRSAVGMGSLPENIAVEIEAVFELN
jgi:enamine deaminase RidA (YjgF/YER057c/UK114 family)